MNGSCRGGQSRGDNPSPHDRYGPDDRRQKRWVTVAQVADMLSITRREVYYMIEDAELPGIKLGRAVRIPLNALEQWIADKEAEAKEARSAYDSKTGFG